MLERLKNTVLILLVVLSILFTGLIWTSQPQYDFIQSTAYQERELLGESRGLEELVRPRQIIFHLGEAKHAVAYPEMGPYRNVLENGLKEWDIFNITPKYLNRDQWEELLTSRQGVEIEYPTGIPVDSLQRLLPIKEDLPKQLKDVSSVWYYIEPDSNNVVALLISKKHEQTFQAKTGLSADSFLAKYVVQGESLTQYKAYHTTAVQTEVIPASFFHLVYLPLENMHGNNFDFFYRPITSEAMQQALFIDPSIVRRIQERDGAVLFTDGKRSMQVNRTHEGMIYYDPFMGKTSSNESTLYDAITFVNEHHGWTDRYYLESIQNESDGTTFIFRKYFSRYPIVSFQNSNLNMDYSAITIKMVGGIITEYQRPLIELDRHYANRSVRILTGDELIQRLHWDGISLLDVNDLYLAREVRFGQDYVRLHQVWVVELKDGSVHRYFNPEENRLMEQDE